MSRLLLSLLTLTFITSGTIYNDCDSFVTQTNDTRKICKIIQSIDFSKITLLSTFNPNQANYCGININNAFKINCVNDDITSFYMTLQDGTDLFDEVNDGILDFSSKLGWPLNIKTINLLDQYPKNGFDFSTISNLNSLQDLILGGRFANRIKDSDITITSDHWNIIASLPSLQNLDIQYRAWDGDMGVISSWKGPITAITV